MSLDLAVKNLAATSEAGYEFELLYPGSDEPTGAFVTVRGAQSPKVKAYARKKYSEFRLKEQQARRRGKDVEEMTLDDAEDLAIEGAIVRIISWRGIAESGVDVPFNAENAARILKEHSWIREQVQEQSDTLLNFQ